MREGTSLAENRSMKSLKLDSFITELNKKQNNKEISLIVVICGSYMKQNYIQLNQQLLM